MGMEIPNHLLNRTLSCDCGREHFIPIEKIVVADHFWEDLRQHTADKGYVRVLVVADANTEEVLGRETVRQLLEGGFDVHRFVFPHRADLLPDENAIRRVADVIKDRKIHIAMAVGSGVINDIVRYATFQSSIPYVTLPTAASMDGFASSIAALQFDGVKTTLPAHTPQAIFCSPRVLSDAPWPLLQSGFGDLVGKVISLLDWKLAHVLYDEPFCAASYEIVLEPLRYCIHNAESLRSRSPDAVQHLLIGLINSGLAMAMVGNSRPASGSEHHCSHFWDFLAYLNQRNHVSHGLQVGYATHWMMRFYKGLEQWEKMDAPALPVLDPKWEAEIRSFYGGGAGEIVAAQRQKNSWLLEHQQKWPSNASGLRCVLDALRPELSLFDRVEQSLIAIGIRNELSYMEMDEQTLRATFLHARELRARYTIFDFLAGQGRLESAMADVFA